MTSDGKRTKARRLRELVADHTVVLPGAFNGLTAMQVERAGFEAVYASGAGMANSRGLPDIGLLSLPEVVSEAGTIAKAVKVPTVADADTGFGPPLMVMRAVREFEGAGLAGIHLEDQESPKRCGHLPGKHLVSVTDMARKIGAAVEARQDPDFFIIARTDARALEGLEGSLRRAQAYVRAGADAIFPEALESAEEFRAFAQGLAQAGVTVPLMANMTEFGKTPYLSVKEFEALGYRLVLFPLSAMRVAMKAIESLLLELKTLGTQTGALGLMQTRQQLYELLCYSDYDQQDKTLYDRYGQDPKG